LVKLTQSVPDQHQTVSFVYS